MNLDEMARQAWIEVNGDPHRLAHAAARIAMEEAEKIAEGYTELHDGFPMPGYVCASGKQLAKIYRALIEGPRGAEMTTCIAYRADGRICGEPAFRVDHALGGMVCAEHADRRDWTSENDRHAAARETLRSLVRSRGGRCPDCGQHHAGRCHV